MAEEEEEKDWTEEIWIFGGLRLTGKDKKWHAWIGPENVNADVGMGEWRFPQSGTFTVGAEYRVRAVRDVDGKIESKYATPVTFVGTHDNVTLRQGLEIRDAAARQRIRELRLEAKAKREPALADALRPIERIAREIPAADRAAFVAMVSHRLYTAWARSEDGE